MSAYAEILNKMAGATGAVFRPAAEADLNLLGRLGLPPSVIEFYAEHEPEDSVHGQARLWTIERMIEENRDLVPGCHVVKFGYVVFASTIYGDAYCFDTHHLDARGMPRIVLISHEVVGEETTAEEAARLAKSIAVDLREFLEHFAAGDLDEESLYE